MKDIFDDDDGSTAKFVLIDVGFGLVALQLPKFRNAHAHAKLTATMVALKHERLPVLVTRFIENRELIALGASHSLHRFIFL